MRTLLLFLPLVCSCSPSASPAAAKIEPTRVFLQTAAVLPLVGDGLPHVRAHIPGVGDLTLLVDTGAEFSWIDIEFAREHDLPHEPLGATLTDIAGVTSEIAEHTYLPRLELGSLAVTEFRPPLLRTLDPEVHGSIGLDVLRVVTVAIDGPGKRLILSPHEDVKAALVDFFEPGMLALTYNVDWSGGTPDVTVQVDGIDDWTTFTIDTGTGQMRVTREFAEALGLEKLGMRPSVGLGFGGGETAEYAVRDLALERLTISDDALEALHCCLGWDILHGTLAVFPKHSDQLLLMIDAVAR